jgi:hypothetical protein
MASAHKSRRRRAPADNSFDDLYDYAAAPLSWLALCRYGEP